VHVFVVDARLDHLLYGKCRGPNSFIDYSLWLCKPSIDRESRRDICSVTMIFATHVVKRQRINIDEFSIGLGWMTIM
jgi:hypothetical protein